MNPTKKIMRLAIFATVFVFISPVAFAGTVTVQHGTLSATLGAPVNFSYTPDWYVVNDPTHIIGLGLQPYATLGSTMASVQCQGSANLSVSQNPGWNTLSLAPSSGTATMNLGLTAGLNIELIAFGHTLQGSLNNTPNWGFYDNQNFSSYLLNNPVTLSGQISQNLVSLNTLDALTLEFGVVIPSWLAEINLNINAVANLDQTIQGANISTSAGAISSEGQLLNVYTSGTSYQLQNVQETWSDSATLSLGLGADMSADLLDGVLSVQLVDFGNVTLISASQTYQLQSSAISTVSFDLSTSGGSTAPVISTVSPSTMTGLPTGQTQLIRIIGSGFTSTSTLTFNDGVNPSYTGRVPFSWNANELDYNISVGTNQANWTAQVVNGSQTSNLGYFTVNAPPTSPTGSLVVNLAPSAATSAGAQWQVDGTGYNVSGQVIGYITPGSHTISFKPVSGYTTPASQIITITANAQTTASATYTTVAPSTYTLALNYNNTQGGASASPSANGNNYTAGAIVQLYASASSGYHFTGWSGDTSSTANPTTITMTGNKNITANFASGDPTMGTVIVTIQPQAAATAGVTWGFNANDYRASGSSYTTFPLTYILTIHPVDGWLGLSSVVATLTAGQTTNITVSFTQDTTPGLLTVTLSPPNVTAAGAHWHVNGGAGQGSGATVQLAPGSGYTITFDSIPGWTVPSGQTVTIQRAQTTVVSGNYTPPVGQPVIATVHPSFGALAGGTALTIEGVNFTTPASVFIGGKLASNITVLNPSQIACLTPSNSVYGTVPVVVQTETGNATNANGFTYGVERGNGIELVSAIGGEDTSVAVQGNYAYIGEGSSFVVADISNPSSPSPVGRLAMPGMMQDVAIFGQYAFAANNDAGLQVVDVSTPSVPKLVGFYYTPRIAEGVAVSGTNAFVVDGTGSFLVFDITTPKSPVLLASTNLGGFAWDVAVSGNFAYVIANGKLVIVDVTNPSSPNVRGQLSIPYYAECLAVSGNRVFVAGGMDGLRMIDVSNPDSPNDVGSAPGVGFPYSVATSGNLVFTAGTVKFAVSSYSAGTMTFLGANNSIVSGSYNLAASGNRAYMPAGANGFSIVDASTPSSPTLLGSLSAVSGDYGSISISGNYLYSSVYAGVNGLKIFDITNPALPIQVGQYSGVGGSQGNVLVTNGVAYLNGSGTETRILSVANPAAPTLLSSIPVTTVYALKKALSGNTLFIAGFDSSDNGKFIAFDVSIPSSPTQRGQIDFTSANQQAISVAVMGNKAVVGLNSGEIKIVDVSNVNSPSVSGGLGSMGHPGDVAISADAHYAFVADGNGNTLRVVDIGTPSSPVQTASVLLASRPTSLCVRSNFVYVVGGGGVLVFDVSVPSSPVLARFYAAPSTVWSYDYGIAVVRDLARNSDTIYIGDYFAGLVVLQTKDTEVPNIQITSPTASRSYTNTTGSLNLTGSASDNGGVTRVTWSNDRGGAGDATGTTNWSVTGILLQPGTNVLTATAFDQAGNSSNATLTVVYQTTNQNQTITFPVIADHTFSDPPIQLVAAASSGLPVTFSVISGPATLSSRNVLTFTGAGAVTVEANQSGNGSFYSATPVDMNFNITRANQSIAFAPIPNHSAGDPPFALSATTSSGLPVYFNVLSGPAALNSSNYITLLGAGTVNVLAWQPGNSNFNAAATVQQSINVSQIPQSITFGALSQQRAGDAPFPISATASSGLPVSFSILSGPAQLSGNILLLIGSGTVTVRASQPGNSVYASAANVDQSLTVLPPNNTIGAAQFTNGGFQLAFYGTVGSNYTLQASSDLVNWTSLFNFTCTNTPTIVVDTQAKNYSKRFYRVAQGTVVFPVTLGFDSTKP